MIAEKVEQPHLLPHAPAELTRSRLRRLGEGIGKVVYASPHWVVKRERSPVEVLALILIWKALRKVTRWLPGGIGRRLLERPSKTIRFIRVCIQPLVSVLPRGLWFMTHAREIWHGYHKSSLRGERLSHEHLHGSALIPERITFPPTKVKVGGWPGWLIVDEAVERVDSTLHQHLSRLASAGRYGELEEWLNRFLDLRQTGWRKGLFSTDAHLKNFGVTGDRIVLLDPGGLTDRWSVVEARLEREEKVKYPHRMLGLGTILASRPDLAARFNERWKATVNRETVRSCWKVSA